MEIDNNKASVCRCKVFPGLTSCLGFEVEHFHQTFYLNHEETYQKQEKHNENMHAFSLKSEHSIKRKCFT